jgi:hypothetical protein
MAGERHGMCESALTGREGPEVEQRYSSTLSLTSALDGGGWSTPRRAPATLPPEKTQYPLYRAPGPVWRGAENIAPPGFDPRTVQHLASHYAD